MGRASSPPHVPYSTYILRELLGGRSQHLAGQAALMHAVSKDDLAADHAIEDALRTFDQARRTTWEIIGPFERTGPDARRVEHDEVGVHPDADAPLIFESKEVRRLRSHALHRGLERHHAALVDPFTQHEGRGTRFAMLAHMGARVGEPDHHFGIGDQFGDRVLVGVDQFDRDAEVEVLRNSEIEERVDLVLTLDFGNLLDALVEQGFVLRLFHTRDRYRIPLTIEECAAARLDVVAKLCAEGGRTVKCDLFLARTIERRFPRRHLAAQRRRAQIVIHLDWARRDLGWDAQALPHVWTNAIEDLLVRLTEPRHVEQGQPRDRPLALAREVQ